MPPNTSTGASLPKSPPAGLTAGVDWAKDDHVVAVVDTTGSGHPTGSLSITPRLVLPS